MRNKNYESMKQSNDLCMETCVNFKKIELKFDFLFSHHISSFILLPLPFKCSHHLTSLQPSTYICILSSFSLSSPLLRSHTLFIDKQ